MQHTQYILHNPKLLNFSQFFSSNFFLFYSNQNIAPGAGVNKLSPGLLLVWRDTPILTHATNAALDNYKAPVLTPLSLVKET